MGVWRALVSRAKGQGVHPFLSTSSLSKLEQQDPRLLAPIAWFETLPPGSCPRLSDRLWPGLDLGFLTGTPIEARQDAQVLLEDAKEFLLRVRKDPGNLEFGHGLQAFDSTKPWLHQGASPQAQDTLSFNAGASVDITEVLLQGTSYCKQHKDESCFCTCHAAIHSSGFRGSEGLSIHADSVKRKRKKKMNKHKHRKLRRLARKSRKR